MQNYARQHGIARYAREAKWVLDSRLMAYHAIEFDKDYVKSARYDGVLALMSKIVPWLPPLVKSLRVPTVDMWSDFPEENYPRVLLDNEAIGRMGADHLLSRGFRNLLFYTHSIEGRAIIRRDSFRQAVLTADAQFLEFIWDHTKMQSQGMTREALLAEQMARIPKPFGVMAGNDHLATEVIEAAEIANLRIPRDVAVLGVDNDPLVTELTEVPLSSIDPGFERVGYESAALLDRLMSGQPPPEAPILIAPARVVTRRSTDAFAAHDRDVATALQFIKKNFSEPISVEDVAGDGIISRRYLQDRFLAETGRTIGDAIRWQRIEHAQKLLTETSGKLRAIASQSGFRSGEHMSKVFRRFFGMTPGEFRDRYSKERYLPNPTVLSPEMPGRTTAHKS